MRNINRVVLTGGLTRDPQLRHTPSGTAVVTLRLGYTTQRKLAGEWQEGSNYVDVELWGGRAESAARHLTRGRQIAVDGRLEWDEYTDREGVRRQTHRVVADRVEYLATGARLDPSPTNAGSGGEESGDAEDIPF